MALPWSLRRRALNLLFGFRIAPGARVGKSLLLVDRCELGAGSRVGNMTMVKGLALLRLDVHARLGNLNWVTGLSSANTRHFMNEPDRDPTLIIERHAAITNRHLVDCTNRVTIGEYATIGGFHTQILTHSVDMATSRQSSAPVVIGAYAFTGTGALILKGAVLPDKSILSAGSVLGKAMTEPGMLYSGNPAAPVRALETDGGYFTREHGYVD